MRINAQAVLDARQSAFGHRSPRQCRARHLVAWRREYFEYQSTGVRPWRGASWDRLITCTTGDGMPMGSGLAKPNDAFVLSTR
jgi:hypothetical protein